MKDTFFYILVATRHNWFLRFPFENTVYIFCILPFRLTLSPFCPGPRQHADFLGLSLDTTANIVCLSDSQLIAIWACSVYFCLGVRVSIHQ